MSNPPTMVIETSSSSRGEAQALPRTRMVDTVDDAPELRRVSHNGPAPPAQPLPRQPMHVIFERVDRDGAFLDGEPPPNRCAQAPPAVRHQLAAMANQRLTVAGGLP